MGAHYGWIRQVLRRYPERKKGEEMPYSDKELIAIGARCVTERLVGQIPVSLAAAKKYGTELGAKFPPAKVEELSALGTKIEALFSAQSGRKFEANTGNVPVIEVLGEVKEGVRDIIAAADNAYEEEPEIRSQFHKGGPLGKSVPGVIRRAKGVIALAEKNSAALAEWGMSVEEVAAVGASVTALSEAETNQEKALTNLPPATAELYLEKGRAYLLLKKLSRAGRRCFSKKPAVAAEFSLDILKRGGSPNKPPTPPPAN
jgi:hypothetical protein